jgi:hypothetical protein
MISRQLTGFKEVRLVPSRPGIGFAEFENEMYSGMAMSQLQGYKMGDKAFKITFSKSWSHPCAAIRRGGQEEKEEERLAG